MKKCYSAPEMELVKFTLKDVVLSSPVESSIPDQGATTPAELPGEELDI